MCLKMYELTYTQPSMVYNNNVYFKYFKDTVFMTQSDVLYYKNEIKQYGGEELFLMCMQAIQHVPYIYMLEGNKFNEKWKSDDLSITRYYYEVRYDRYNNSML